MKKERRLLIDDCRSETDLYQQGQKKCKVHVIARNYWEGIKQLKDNGPWDLLYLDHDLQSYDKDNKESTGYDIMCFLEEHIEYLPSEIICVSSNPSGKKRIEQVIEVIKRRIENDYT
jgi:hypothetical protein